MTVCSRYSAVATYALSTMGMEMLVQQQVDLQCARLRELSIYV